MAKKQARSQLYKLISSKRVRDKLHPRVEERDRMNPDGSRKRIREDEFTEDGFPWGGRNMGDLL
jgi:hypothetical protein